MSAGVFINGRAVVAIRKHIGASEPLTCACKQIRINESPVRRIIITRLQIIESRLGIVVISAIPQRIDFGQFAGAGENISPRIILVCRDRLILKAGDIVDQFNNVTLQVQNVIICLEARSVRRILERKRLPGFIIDEINRGEISKIFGELFFAIDPGYRGKAGEISTQ